MAKEGNLKLDFMVKSIGIHFFEFEDIFRCYRDNENLKKTFWPYGHFNVSVVFRDAKLDFTIIAVDKMNPNGSRNLNPMAGYPLYEQPDFIRH